VEYQDRITNWITPGASLLDLGCGDGSLLAELKESRQVRGYGVEKDPGQITACLEKGLNVLQFDLDEGLASFNDESFDLVILKHTLQALHKPDVVLREMLRVGKKGIVTFPNFSHWYNRWYLAWKGEMPVSRAIPFNWYDTPNLHHCTCRDFEALCRNLGLTIEDCILQSAGDRRVSRQSPLANLRAQSAMYLIRK